MISKLLLITAFSVMRIILINGCISEEKTKEPGDEIQNIGEAVPQGWNYTITQNFIGEVTPDNGYGKIITQNSEEMPVPHGLWKPVAIVNFVNLNKEIEYFPGVKTDRKYILRFDFSLQCYRKTRDYGAHRTRKNLLLMRPRIFR